MRRRTLAIALVLLAGCASGHWRNLPDPRPGVLAYHAASDPDARRATIIARTLSAAKPLPVEKVYVLSSRFLNEASGALRVPDDNAGSWRCGKGDPPSYGCIYVGDRLLSALSDDALAGILAHELGHLERGHRPTGALAAALRMRSASLQVCHQPALTRDQAFRQLIACNLALSDTLWAASAAQASQDAEREADASGVERLAAAGYCAGLVMRGTFVELSRLFPGKGTGGLLASHPGYAERWQNAGSGCEWSTKEQGQNEDAVPTGD